METLRFDYKPKAWIMALAGLFFAGCGVVLGRCALANERGLILNGLVDLDPGDATIVYWILTALCGLFVLAAVFGVIRALGAPQEVVLDARALTAPQSGLGRALVIVPLTTITDLQITQMKSQKFLIVHHSGGKLTILRSMLPTRDDFETLIVALDTRCRALRGR